MSHKLLVKDPRGQREILLVGTMTVGRDPRCDISDADPLLSRRHAEFVVSEGGVLVRDLNSRNGILVNGRKVPQAVLQPGDVVQVSGLAITLISTTPRSAAPAPAAGPGDDRTLLVTPLPLKRTPGTMAGPAPAAGSPGPAGGAAPEELETQPGTRLPGVPAAGPPPAPPGERAAAPGPSGQGEPIGPRDGTIRIPRPAKPPVAETPAAETVVVARKPPAAFAGDGGTGAATGGPVTTGSEAATVYVPRAPAPGSGGPAVAAPPAGSRVEPTADGPIDKVVGVEPKPAPAAEPSAAPARPAPAAESAEAPGRRAPAAPAPDDDRTRFTPPPADDDRTRFAPPPADDDRTRFAPPPGPMPDLPFSRVPAAPVQAARAARVTPVREPSKAGMPWTARVVVVTIGTAAVGALGGVAASRLVDDLATAVAAAVVVAVGGGLAGGLVLARLFRASMAALADDIDLAVIGRLSEVGDPFGDASSRDLADAMNELVARVRDDRG